MNKTSVREEVDRVKQEFEQLSLAGKVTPEVKVLMNSMLLVVELILSVFLEKQTRKNSKNSSLPSSQTDRDETAKPTSTGKGKGKKVSGEISTPVLTKLSPLPKLKPVMSAAHLWIKLLARGSNGGQR
ncbi:hypothetical protein [uncultured Desulfobacter sp.]|uniref:hypothetical protein n=1 Tax=uncultured Desulfobacter sp. TaxID=240139 RepID=UPI0029F4D7DE|nr:hypothetical protein [uncultured Desulfobacter sp.]